jgi:predicted acetyltransferase
VRPSEQKFRGDCGLWIGEAWHGKGYGTRVVAELKRIAFEQIKMEKLEAGVFVGNIASRRIFEKNGFQLEGTSGSQYKNEASSSTNGFSASPVRRNITVDVSVEACVRPPIR